LLQPARDVFQVLTRLLPRKLLEAPCGLFGLVSERPLLTSASAALILARRCETALPLRLGLLSLGQLLELFRNLIDLFIRALLIGPLLHLVLVRQLIELEGDEIREVGGHR